MHIDTSALKHSSYKDFILHHLKTTNYIIISMTNETIPNFDWHSTPIPQKINYHSIIFSQNEHLYCFKNTYYDVYDTLSSYNSMKDFFDLNNIYRLMFVSNNEIIIECMSDEIIMHKIWYKQMIL